MKCYFDLHIHTALSPCADPEMTPNNIVNMAILKGLDFIAITDHNTTGNLQAVIRCAQNKGLIVIPGLEIETCEEVHMICLLPSLEDAQKLDSILRKYLPTISNREDIFGAQILYNEYDQIVGYEEQLLVTATSLSIERVKKLVEELGGIAIPAHVDRPSFSIFSNLAFIPEELNFTAVELSKKVNIQEFIEKNPTIEKYRLIKNSDAHFLHDISERENYLDLKEKSIDCFISYLKG